MRPGELAQFVYGIPVADYVAVVEVVGPGSRDGMIAVRSTADRSIEYQVSARLLSPVPLTAPPARQRVADHSTSVAAAVSVGDRLTDAQWKVLDALAAAGPTGLIDHDHHSRNGLGQDTAGKRRGELVHAGLVVDTGRKRSTDRGRLAKVWTLTPAGQALWSRLRAKGAA